MKRFFAFIFMLAVGWGYLAAGDSVEWKYHNQSKSGSNYYQKFPS